ncbi:MAG: glutamine-hydrolyzing GMP synthase, partial [Neisseriaceae bacterium]|nr:glutamine-hydrolyzing GMP synthase [Neisseriaceae bacterium]
MDKILILDFGSQVSQLIARRVREASVYCEMHAYDYSLEQIKAFNPKGIILSGGPNSVYNSDYQADPEILNLGVPVLGICYGMQWIAHTLGGKVAAGNQREFGYASVAVDKNALTDGIADNNQLDVWMSHGDKVSVLPENFVSVAHTPSCPVAIMENREKKIYGVQFHPEVTHTPRGKDILNRFVLDICGAKPEWTMPNFIEEAVAKIRATVGSDEVILGLSGGVDSSVAAALIYKAIGSQLTCVFVDHGLLRLNEADNVLKMFSGKLSANIIHINAADKFMSKLQGI